MAYFQAIQLHNWLFPKAPLRFEGFVQEEGRLRPVVSQPHVEAVRGATQTEVDLVMLGLGFEPIRNRDHARQYDYLSKPLGVEVNDLHDENALMTKAGDVVVIDPVPLMEEASKLVRLAALGDNP